MQIRKKKKVCLVLLLLLWMPYSLAQDVNNQDGKTEDLLTSKATTQEITRSAEGILVYDLTLDERRIVRRQIVKQFVISYNENHIFEKVAQYMLLYYKANDKTKNPRRPDLILQDTLDKAGNLIVQTRKFVGSSFSKVYEPELIKKKSESFYG